MPVAVRKAGSPLYHGRRKISDAPINYLYRPEHSPLSVIAAVCINEL